MSFFQKNKSIMIVVLMVGFLVVIVSIFVSGVSDTNSNPTPTGILSQQMNLATSTGNVPSAPRLDATPLPDKPSGTSNPPPGVTAQAVTESAPSLVSSPPPTVRSSVTDAPPPQAGGTPPPTVASVDEGPPGTDFPPPLTFVPPPTETPPPGNGPPPGS